MHTHHKESTANGFRHICRRLADGEALPRLPTLVEQALACRFELDRAEQEQNADDGDRGEELDGLE
jgi:hypothetical protein